MSADGVTRILAVGIICIRVAEEIRGRVTAKDEGERPGAFEVSEHPYCSGPMFCAVAIEEGRKATDSIGNVRSSSNGNVVEASNKLAVWRARSPLSYLGQGWSRLVRAAEMEACDHWGISGMCICLSEAIQDAVDECCLREGDGVAITVYGNAECELSRAEVRDFPLGLEFVSEARILLWGPGDGKNVVDVDSKDDGAGRGATDINAPFARDARESPFLHGLVESLVPSSTSLAHTINALHKAHDPCLLARFFETRRLLHEGHFVITQNAMEEGCFDVEMLDVPT